MLLVLFELFFTQISQNSRIFLKLESISYLSVLNSQLSAVMLPTGGSRAAGSKFKVQGSAPSGSPEGEGKADAGYVLSVHDFCHERLRVGALAGISANQASLLALAAPKIQGSDPPPTPPRGRAPSGVGFARGGVLSTLPHS